MTELWYKSTAATLTAALAATAEQTRPPDAATGKVRKHGGKRMTCPHCGSERLIIKTVCGDCGGMIAEERQEAAPHDAVRPADVAQPPAQDGDPTPHLAARGGCTTTAPQNSGWLAADAPTGTEGPTPHDAVRPEPPAAETCNVCDGTIPATWHGTGYCSVACIEQDADDDAPTVSPAVAPPPAHHGRWDALTSCLACSRPLPPGRGIYCTTCVAPLAASRAA
jgi:hypothetical protein